MDLSHLLEGSGDDGGLPPLRDIVGRSRRLRSHRIRSVGVAGLLAALSAGGTGLGLALSAGSGALVGAMPAYKTTNNPQAPQGLSMVARRSVGAVANSLSNGASSKSAAAGGTGQACTIRGCYQRIFGGLLPSPVKIPAPRVGDLVLSAQLYRYAAVPVAQPFGWAPQPRGVGIGESCAFGPYLYVTVRPWGSATVTGDLLVPSGGSSGHPIDTAATAVLGSASSGRVEVLVVRVSSSVSSVTASWNNGRTVSARPTDGWVVLAVPYGKSSPNVVSMFAAGGGGSPSERAVVPADGALFTIVRACKIPIITAPVDGGGATGGAGGSAGSSPGNAAP